MEVIGFWKLDDCQNIYGDNYAIVSDIEKGLELVQKLADADQKIYHAAFYPAECYTALPEKEDAAELEIVTWKIQKSPLHIIEPKRLL